MRLTESAHGFDLSGSVDRFFRKGSFGKDEEQITHETPQVRSGLLWGRAMNIFKHGLGRTDSVSDDKVEAAISSALTGLQHRTA